MATIALGLAGAQWAGLGVVGSTTVAGILGTTVGGYVDSAFLMPSLFGRDSADPSYGGLNLTAADEGSPVWRVHGTSIRVPGLVLFVNEPRVESQTNRLGKRGETTTRTWYTDCVFGFGKVSGTADNFVERVYVNNALVIDQRSAVQVDTQFGTVDVVGSGTSLTGVISNYDQFAVLPQFTDQGANRGAMSFETTPKPLSTLRVASVSGVAGRPFNQLVTFNSSHGLSPGEARQTSWTAVAGTPSGIWAIKRYWYLYAHESDPTQAWALGDVTPSPSVTWDVTFLGSQPNEGEAVDLTVFDSAGKDVEFTIGGGSPIKWLIYDNRVLPDGRTSLRLLPSSPGVDGDLGRHLAFSVNQTAMRSPNSPFWDALANNGQTLTLRQERTPYNLSVLESGASQVDFGYGISRDAGGTGTADQQPMPRLVDFVGETLAPGYRDMFAVAFEDWNLSSTGNALGNVEGVVRCDDTTIGEVVTNICATHGVDTSRLDVSGLSGTVRGYRYNGVIEGRQALQPLLLAFDVRARETDAGIVMFHSEDSPTLTIPEGDWLGGGNQPRLGFRERNTQIRLRSVQVKFLDADKDQAPGTVTEVRQSEVGGETRVLSLDNLVLTADEARSIARRVLRQTRAQQFEVEGSLPMSYAALTENTVITTTMNGRSWRFRATRVDVGADFEVRVAGLQEEVYA